jgi:Mce-associated membrane protein
MRRARVLAGVGLALAVGFCGTGAWTYAQARGDDALAYSRQRDEALTDGRRAIAVLNTLDASSKTRAQAGIRAWRAASTGPLQEELGRTVPKTGASARGTVTEAAVTALDARAGTAELIATVRVDVTPAGSKTPTTDRKRLEAVLARTGEGEWKVKALDAVPLARTAEEDDGR